MALDHKYQVDGRGFNSLQLVSYYVGMSRDLVSRCFRQLGNNMTKEQMLGFRGRAAPGHRLCVTYNGKSTHIDDIAAAEGVTDRQMYDWWRRNGQPPVITGAMVKKIREVATKAVGIYTLLPDGTRHGGRELCEMFGLSHSAVSNRRSKTGHTVFTRSELQAMADRSKSKDKPKAAGTKEYPPPLRPRSIHDVEYHPSAMERSIMGLR